MIAVVVGIAVVTSISIGNTCNRSRRSRFRGSRRSRSRRNHGCRRNSTFVIVIASFVTVQTVVDGVGDVSGCNTIGSHGHHT